MKDGIRFSPVSPRLVRVGDSMYVNRSLTRADIPKNDWLKVNSLVHIVEASGDDFRVVDKDNPTRGFEKKGGWWVSASHLELFKELEVG